MNKLFIIGNLTRDPELRNVRTQDSEVSVCDFTVAVNRKGGSNEADYFRVTAWRGLGENCQRFLAKGRKVAVVGPVSCRTYQASDGSTRATLEIKADEVEFLSPRQDGAGSMQQAYQHAAPAYQNAPAQPQYRQQRIDQQSGFIQVEEEDLPF